jgi:hypothetical protein
LRPDEAPVSAARKRRPRYAPTEGPYADRGMVVMVMDPQTARDLADHYGYRDLAYRELNNAADEAEREWFDV